MFTACIPRGRIWRVAAAAASLAVVAGMAACSSGSSSDDNGNVTIRFGWWGDAGRNDRMQKAIDLFEAANPGIKVKGEFVDWAGYWDKLATQVAGGNAPDVFMQEDRYIGDYAHRNVLADLGSMGIKTDDIDKTLLSNGQVNGKQYGIPTGSNVFSVVANPAIFKAAGVALPDDTKWTWDDYERISEAITKGSPKGVYGTSDYSYSEVGFVVYARQHGQDLFNKDGKLGYDDKLLQEWFERSQRLIKAGGQPPADDGLTLDLLDSPIAKDKAAMSMTWSAQVGALSKAAGDEMVLLRLPGETQFQRTGMYYKPGMYLSQWAKSKHPEAAAKFINFFANSVDVYKVFLTELGLPGSAAVRQGIESSLPKIEQDAANFVGGLNSEIVDARNTLPKGASETEDIMQRINAEVLFGRMSPAKGAQEFRKALESAIS